MIDKAGGRIYIVLLTILIGFLLTLMPLPEWAENFRPQWVTLVVIYWCMALPERIGVSIAWMVGLCQDVLVGSLLGQHALSMAIIAYITLKLYLRVRVLPLRQQMFTILVLLVVERILALWINWAVGYPSPSLWYWAEPIIGALLWPWIYILLRDVRRRFKVS